MRYLALPLMALLGCAATAQANDFPTLERVEYVLGCMDEQGGQNYNNLYSCVCMIDTIAAEFTVKEYSEAVAFATLRSTPGERGGVFRDPPRAEQLRDKLQQVRQSAANRCMSKQN